jgi:hypothetical protein
VRADLCRVQHDIAGISDICSLSGRVYDKERGSDVFLRKVEIACPHSFPSSYHAAQSMRRYALERCTEMGANLESEMRLFNHLVQAYHKVRSSVVHLTSTELEHPRDFICVSQLRDICQCSYFPYNHLNLNLLFKCKSTARHA